MKEMQDGTYSIDDVQDFHEFLDLKEALIAHDREEARRNG
jgi:hypothetical protein